MKITPDLLRKIGKGAKDLLLKSIKTAKAAAGKTAAAGKFQEAEIAISKIPVTKIAKGILTAELGDDLAKSIFELPVAKQAYSILQGIDNFKIQAQKATFYKLPIIGPLLLKVAKGTHEVIGNVADVLGLEMIADEAHRVADQLGYSNNPDWYTHIGEHVPFSIPMGYPDSFTTDLSFANQGYPRNRVVAIDGLINYSMDVSKISQRMNQLMVLLKGVRGLSQVIYTVTDIFNYERSVCTLATMYFNTCKMIKLAKLFNVMKSQWPDELLRAIGAPTNISTNLALYENLAFQMKQALAQLPIFGTILDKVKYLCLALVADSKDTLIATYYVYNVKSRAFNRTDENTKYESWGFTSYTDLAEKFNTLHSAVMNDERYAAIMGDCVGAFGNYAMRDYAVDLSPYDINKCYDELGLSMIQNAYSAKLECSLVNNTGLVLLSGNTVTDLGYLVNTYKWEFFPESYASGLQYNMLARSVVEKKNTFEPGEATVYIVPHTGMNGATFKLPATNGEGFKDELINDNAQVVLNTNKYKLSEGESLEIMQNAGYVTRVWYNVKHETAPNEDDANYSIALFSRVGFFAITSIRCVNFPYGEVPLDYYLNTPYETEQSAFMQAITLWSQADWAPKMVVRSIHKKSNTNSITDYIGTMWDSNVFGYLTRETLDIGIGYSAYSLYAPNVKAGGKTIDNIRDVYNTK